MKRRGFSVVELSVVLSLIMLITGSMLVMTNMAERHIKNEACEKAMWQVLNNTAEALQIMSYEFGEKFFPVDCFYYHLNKNINGKNAMERLQEITGRYKNADFDQFEEFSGFAGLSSEYSTVCLEIVRSNGEQILRFYDDLAWPEPLKDSRGKEFSVRLWRTTAGGYTIPTHLTPERIREGVLMLKKTAYALQSYADEYGSYNFIIGGSEFAGGFIDEESEKKVLMRTPFAYLDTRQNIDDPYYYGYYGSGLRIRIFPTMDSSWNVTRVELVLFQGAIRLDRYKIVLE